MTLWWDCEIKGCYKDLVLPDWGFLTGCFPRGIKPTDVDGMVHLQDELQDESLDRFLDRFLFLEKKGLHGSLTEGQRRAFHALSRQHDIEVLCLRGAGHETNEMIWYPKPDGWRYADEGRVQEACRRWAEGEPFWKQGWR